MPSLLQNWSKNYNSFCYTLLDWLSVQDPTSFGQAGVWIAQTPVHGKVRNYLYFGGHAAPKKVQTYNEY